MHYKKLLLPLLVLLNSFYDFKAQAQPAQAYFTTPASDTGVNFSDSRFHTILPTGTGYVSIGLCKTISLTQMCSGIVAAFKDSNGRMTSYHRYFDCDSVAAVAGASGIVTLDGYLIMAYMAFEPLYLTGSGDMYLYLIKASLNNPANYTTRRIVINDSYDGGAPFDITHASTRIIRNNDGSYNVLVPSANRMNLCHMSSSLQVLNTKELRIPAGQGGPYKRYFDIGYSNICALPSGDVLTTCVYQVIDTTTMLSAGSGTVVNRVTNGGVTHYTKVYETSLVNNSGFISTTNQLYSLSNSKVIGVGVAGGPSLYTIDPTTGSISNGKYIQAPQQPNDSNNYTDNLGIVKTGNSLLVYRVVKNYSALLPYDQLGVIKTDTNLNLMASRKFSYRGIFFLSADNGTPACVSNNGLSIVMSLDASGYGKDSTMQETGEAIVKVDAGMTSTCADRSYGISDQLVSMTDPTPATLTVDVVSSSAYTATVRNNILHDTATAFYQRNLCLGIPGHQPTGIVNMPHNSGVRLFPNPTSGVIYIETPTRRVRSAEVYTLTGARVLAADSSSPKTIDCSPLASGLYIIKLTCGDGSVIIQKISRQ